jgi:hypothetical protein
LDGNTQDLINALLDTRIVYELYALKSLHPGVLEANDKNADRYLSFDEFSFMIKRTTGRVLDAHAWDATLMVAKGAHKRRGLNRHDLRVTFADQFKPAQSIINHLAFGQDLLQDGMHSREALVAVYGNVEKMHDTFRQMGRHDKVTTL